MTTQPDTTDVLIYGASDDLIEVEGALTEEFQATSGTAYVYASTGDIVRFRFEDEGWRATLVHQVRALPDKRPGHPDDDAVRLTGGVDWVVATEVPAVRGVDPTSVPVAPVLATNESAADLCRVVAFLIDNPQGSPGTWLDHVPSEARQQLATWLRTEAHAFRHDHTRASVYGFPSWYFARAVGNAFADSINRGPDPVAAVVRAWRLVPPTRQHRIREADGALAITLDDLAHATGETR